MQLDELNDITASLRQMPDQALQRFAMMHKDDPYIMALAVSESTQRKKMRAAATTPKVTPSPTIADAEIAQMGMPDMGGIAALPAPNMETMNAAAGGIVGGTEDYDMAVGYADGGMVERYNGQTGSYTGSYEDLPLYQRPSYGTVDKLLLSPFNAAEKRRIDPVTGEPISFGEFLRRQEAERARMATPSVPVKGSVPPIEGMLDEKTGRAIVAARPAGPPTGARTSDRAPASGTPSAGAAVPNIDEAKRLAGAFSSSDAVSMATQSMEDLAQAENAAARARLAQGKPGGKAYEGLEALLKKEGDEAAGEKDKARSMMFLEAGLAMMSGTSRNAFENIGQGALKGLAGYKDAIKDFKKSERERTRAIADIEQARRAEERDDWKSKQQFEEKAADRLFNAKKFGIDALVQSRVADSRTAGSIYERMVAESGANRRAQMQLGQEPAEVRTLRALVADPKLMAAQQQLAASRGSGVNALLGKYADPAELALLKTTNPELYQQVIAAMQRAMMPTPVANPGGPVRP